MRMWHYRLLPYLPDMQLKGQLRELVAIMHNWRDTGMPRHMLINVVVNYDKAEFYSYFEWYKYNYEKRFGKSFNKKYVQEFQDFCNVHPGSEITPKDCMLQLNSIFESWHNKCYLRVCMANLYEKHRFSYMGRSEIGAYDWQRLCEGYKYITGEDYEI